MVLITVYTPAVEELSVITPVVALMVKPAGEEVKFPAEEPEGKIGA